MTTLTRVQVRACMQFPGRMPCRSTPFPTLSAHAAYPVLPPSNHRSQTPAVFSAPCTAFPNILATPTARRPRSVQPVEVAGLAHMSLPLPAAEPPLPPAAAGGVGSPAPTQASAGMPRCDAYKLSIIMAYCDGGTLRDALRLGLFRKPWPPPAAAPAGGGGGSGVTGYVLGGGGLHNQQSQNQVYVQRQGSKAAAFVAALGTGGAPVEGPPAAATVAAAVGGGAAATSPGVGASPSASTSAEPAPQQQQQQQQPQQQQQQLGSSSSSLLPPLQENAGAAAHAAVAMPSAAGRRVSTGPPSARGQGRRPCSSGQIQLPADGGGGAAAPGGSGGSGGGGGGGPPHAGGVGGGGEPA